MPGEYGTAYAVNRASDVIPIDSSGNPVQGLKPLRVQCAKCPNHVTKYVKVRTMYALPRNHPQVQKEGVDRQVIVELWCLSCIRSANVEDDYYRTRVSIATG